MKDLSLRQFDLIFASYFLHLFISLTLASLPIKKHVRNAIKIIHDRKLSNSKIKFFYFVSCFFTPH